MCFLISGMMLVTGKNTRYGSTTTRGLYLKPGVAMAPWTLEQLCNSRGIQPTKLTKQGSQGLTQIKMTIRKSVLVRAWSSENVDVNFVIL